MDKCSCGRFEFNGNWRSVAGCWVNIHFCPDCGDELLPDGRIIKRETVPSALMEMLDKVTKSVPDHGLTEFALMCFNRIEAAREKAGLTQRELGDKAGVNAFEDFNYEWYFLTDPPNVKITAIFSLLNAAEQAAKEATE